MAEFLKTMAITVIVILAVTYFIDILLEAKLLKTKRAIAMEKINGIVRSRYNNYKGAQYQYLQVVHQNMLDILGAEKFLAFLIEQERINPKPKYETPHEYYNRIKATVKPLKFTPSTTTAETIDIDHEEL